MKPLSHQKPWTFRRALLSTPHQWRLARAARQLPEPTEGSTKGCYGNAGRQIDHESNEVRER